MNKISIIAMLLSPLFSKTASSDFLKEVVS